METGVNFSLPGPASGYACAPEDRSDEADTDNDLSMLPSDFEPGESDVICQRGK